MNPPKEMEFDSISSKCMSPLIETEYEENWFEVEGCGLQCEDPFFSPEEHDKVHHRIGILSTVGFTLSALAMITFVINRKVSNSYPGIIVFCMSICLTLVNFGYLIQFFPGAREKIVCNGDGTIRLQHPRAGENWLCVITFFLIYYFLLAFWIWFGLLSYSWYVTFHGSGANKVALKKKWPYFHISAWCIPFVPTVAIMAIKQVNGDPMRGICFVSFSDDYMLLVFWLVPLLIAKLVVFIFVISVLIILIRVKLKTTNLEEKKVVLNFLLRIGICIMGLFYITVSDLWYYAYDFAYHNKSMESLRVYIVCKAMHSAKPGELPRCGLKSRPGPYILPEINICVLSIMTFTLVMRPLETLRDFFRLCSPSTRSTRNFEKHKLNLKTFQQINQVDISSYISDSFNQANLDSMSMQISEQEYTQVLRHQRRKTRKERERFIQASRVAWVAGRRGSDSSLQSSLMTVSIVAAKNLKVSKSTSTGDLEAQAAAALQAAAVFGIPLPQGASVNPPRAVPQDTIIPPFMHGMDGDCGLDPGLHPRRDRRTTRSTARTSNQQRLPMFPPGAFQSPTNGVVPPIYKFEYDLMNLPFWYMYPANMYAAAGYNYAAAPQLAFGQSAYAIFQNCPEQSRVDSTSEGEFPIFSNSDYTDCSYAGYPDFKYRKQDIYN